MKPTSHSFPGMLVLCILVSGAPGGAFAGSEPPAGAPVAETSEVLPVLVGAETSTSVTLHVDVRNVAPDTIQVLLSEDEVVVIARDRAGRQLRSRPIRVGAPLTEEGAEADALGDDWLTLTFQKEKAEPAPAP